MGYSRVFFLLILLMVAFNSCCPDDSPEIPDDNSNLDETITDSEEQSDDSNNESFLETQNISGNILLPGNSTLELNQLEVVSFTNESGIIDDNYDLNVPEGGHNVLFVSNEVDEVILLGYNYPGQTDFTISAESTVLALMMSLPINSMLSPESRTELVSNILSDPEFDRLSQEVELVIASGVSPLDENNIDFISDLVSVFESSISNKAVTSKLEDDPVSINRSNKFLNFTNPGKSYDVEIGVYKDGKNVADLELDRVTFVATSIEDAIFRITTLLTDNIGVESVDYEMYEDGIYEFKIRNGVAFDGSPEDLEARIENVSKIVLDLYLAVTPFSSNVNANCIGPLIANISGLVSTALSQTTIESIDNSASMMAFANNILSTQIQNFNTFFGECLGIDFQGQDFLVKWAGSMGKLLKWNKVVSAFGTTASLTITAAQLFSDNPALDICFEVENNDVEDCFDFELKEGDLILIYSDDFGYIVDIGTWTGSDIDANGTGFYRLSRSDDVTFSFYEESEGANGYIYIGDDDSPNANRFSCLSIGNVSSTGIVESYENWNLDTQIVYPEATGDPFNVVNGSIEGKIGKIMLEAITTLEGSDPCGPTGKIFELNDVYILNTN